MSLNDSLDSGLEQSKYSDLVAFTSTFYKDDVEGRVRSEACFEMLDNAQKLGIRIVIGDGGSDWEFIKRLGNYPNITLFHSGKGGENTDLTMAGERRFTGKIAMDHYPDASYFLWLEPEKTDLMNAASIDAILDPMRNGGADIVVPSRKSKATLPPQQRKVENRANRRAIHTFTNGMMKSIRRFKNDYSFLLLEPIDIYRLPQHYDDYTDKNIQNLNAPYDFWFGPKAFTRSSMEEDFLSYKGAKWDGIITSVLVAKKRGKNILDVPVDFKYSPKQTALETNPADAGKYERKRLIQYRYIMKTIRNMVRDSVGNNTK